MSNLKKYISGVIGGGPILNSLLERQLRFILFVFALVIIYISLHYAVGQTFVERRRLERELKNLHVEYRTCMAEFMFLSKREEVSKHLTRLGSKVHAPIVPPKRIIMEDYPNE
ncbi:MAG: FtsL-like putative cell division protein [Bacteroidales bacterium]|nr:FtsL-like putative cell division protein [Bacteroidales bacterium]